MRHKPHTSTGPSVLGSTSTESTLGGARCGIIASGEILGSGVLVTCALAGRARTGLAGGNRVCAPGDRNTAGSTGRDTAAVSVATPSDPRTGVV